MVASEYVINTSILFNCSDLIQRPTLKLIELFLRHASESKDKQMTKGGRTDEEITSSQILKF